MPTISLAEAVDELNHLTNLSTELETELFLNPDDEEDINFDYRDYARTKSNQISRQYEALLDHVSACDELTANNSLRKDIHYNFSIHLVSRRYYAEACSKRADREAVKKQFLQSALNYSKQGIEQMEHALNLCDEKAEQTFVRKFLQDYRDRHQQIENQLNRLELKRPLRPTLFVETKPSLPLPTEPVTPNQTESTNTFEFLDRVLMSLSPTNQPAHDDIDIAQLYEQITQFTPDLFSKPSKFSSEALDFSKKRSCSFS